MQHALERLPTRLAIVYAVLLLVMLKVTVEAVYADADVASGPFIGDLYPGSGGVWLGNLRWFEAFWLERATRWVPGHRYLWTYGAYALTLLSLAAVGWSAAVATRRRWAGFTFFAVPFCAPAALITWQFAWSGHALAWVHVLLTGAFLVSCAATGGWFARSIPAHVVITLLLCALTPLGYASDRVLEAALLVPLLAGGVLLLRMLPPPVNWRVGSTALAIGVAAILLAPTFTHAADKAQIHWQPNAVTRADAARRAQNLNLFWKAAPRLMGGDWSNPPADPGRRLLAKVCALSALALLIAGIAYAVGIGLKALARPRQVSPPLTAFVSFWGLSVGGMIGAWIYSTGAVDLQSSRYLPSAAYGVVALAAVASAQRLWSRAAVGLALGFVALAGVVSLAHRDLRADPSLPTRKEADAVARVGKAWGVTKGYAGYWSAAPISWYTRDEFHIYPTDQCQPDTVCRFNLHIADNWFRDSKQKTMIVLDRAVQLPKAFLLSTDPRFGKPIYTEDTGRLLILVYPYDVFEKFGPK